MKSIANQYRDLKEGRMSQFNFMRNLRMSMPQYITNVTSFNDAVRILKNKAILTESEQGGPSIDQMSREEMIDFLGTTASIVKDLTDDELRDIVKDKNADLGEAYDGPSEPRGNEALGDYYEAVGEELEDIARQKYKLNEKEIEQMFDIEWHSGKNDDAIRKYFKEGDEPSVVAERIIEDYIQVDSDIEDQIKRMEDEESGKYTKFQDFEGGLSEEELNEYEHTYRKINGVCYKIDDEGNRTRVADHYCRYSEDLNEDKKETYDKGDLVKYKNFPQGSVETGKVVKDLGDKVVVFHKEDGIEHTISKDKLVEAKKKKESKAELHPNQIHPGELRMGIRVEMEHTNDPEKAKKIALDHLAENPYYYTALKLAGVESPSAPKVKAPVEKKTKKKKEAVELVDKANAMQKVKMPKVVKENLNEAGGEYTFNGTLTDDEKRELDKILGYKGSYELEVDEVDDHYETTIIHDFYNDKNLEHAVKQVTGRLPQKKQFGDTIGFGNVLQSKLEALVREVMAEMYDGRDNLTDITDDTK